VIIDTAAELKKVSSDVIVLRRSQQHGQSLVHRTELVNGLLARAQVAVSSAIGLSERLQEPWSPPPIIDAALTKLLDWAEALEADLGAALAGDLFAQFQNTAEKAVQELESRATGTWQRYTAQSTPETSGEILAALSSDPRARSTVVTIRRLGEAVRRLRDRPVPSADEIREYDRDTASLREAWMTLDVAGLNEETLAFLRAANSDHGAALSLLTPTVRAWLSQRSLESHYTIRPAD
jgi:hypothetical protein